MINILNVGVQDDNEQEVNDKIMLSNRVALLMAGVGFAYVLFSILFFPRLIFLPALCMVFCGFCIYLNHIGYNNVARVILSSLIMALAYFYHALLVQPGEDYIISMGMIGLSLTLIPWVIIDYKEYVLIAFALVVCYTMFFSQPWANANFNLEMDSTLIRSGFLHYFTLGFAVIITISCLIFLQYKSFISEKKNNQLMEDVKSQANEMRKQQDELQDTLHQINLAKEEEAKRNWIVSGLTDFGVFMRRNSEKKTFYHDLISKIVKYMEANQGGIYLVEGKKDNRKLVLNGCYAYDRNKYLKQEYAYDDGLLGQCFLERDLVHLKEIPNDYVAIKSGLGGANPNSLLLAPLLSDGQIEGVVEIASFKPFEKHHMEFLSKLGENIAAFIGTERINNQTKELLSQSQMQAEEMRAQEEEMRQNMEEMQSTQEELSRKERDYINRIDELEALARKHGLTEELEN